MIKEVWFSGLDYLHSQGMGDDQAILALTAATVIALGLGMHWAYTSGIRLMGKRKMKQREKRKIEVRETIEDIFVDGLSEAIHSKRINIEEARIIYAKLAHVGFWGLHPRKFTPNKTQEELDALKEQLKARKAARTNTKEPEVTLSVAASKLFGELDAMKA